MPREVEGLKAMSPCRWLTLANEISHGGQWGKPEEILELEHGVKCIAAGTHSSAVVSDEGELYLWGKLINKASGTLPFQCFRCDQFPLTFSLHCLSWANQFLQVVARGMNPGFTLAMQVYAEGPTLITEPASAHALAQL